MFFLVFWMEGVGFKNVTNFLTRRDFYFHLLELTLDRITELTVSLKPTFYGRAGGKKERKY